MSSKHGYPLRIELCQSFPDVQTWTPLFVANLIDHFPAVPMQMPLVKANLIIHCPKSVPYAGSPKSVSYDLVFASMKLCVL